MNVHLLTLALGESVSLFVNPNPLTTFCRPESLYKQHTAM